MANHRLTRTVPQATFEASSETVPLLHRHRSLGPPVHRMLGATTFAQTSGFASLSMGSRQVYPLAALPMGLEYCSTIGTVELDEYTAFFRPAMMAASAETERTLGIAAGRPVIYYPRRSFDMWGARYFVLPATPNMANTMRGIASFLDKTKLIYPTQHVLYSRRPQRGSGLASPTKPIGLPARMDRSFGPASFSCLDCGLPHTLDQSHHLYEGSNLERRQPSDFRSSSDGADRGRG